MHSLSVRGKRSLWFLSRGRVTQSEANLQNRVSVTIAIHTDPLPNVYLSFPEDLFRVFVIAKRDEFSVSQMVGTSPLQKCYLSHGLGPQPQCRMPDYAACIVGTRFRRQFEG